jgi:hypothetical protein
MFLEAISFFGALRAELPMGVDRELTDDLDGIGPVAIWVVCFAAFGSKVGVVCGSIS